MTGLRLPVDRIRKRLKRVEATITADAFRPELLEFTGRALATALENTPVRNEALIESNQQREYEHRVNYIPSIHWRAEPRMIVNESGVKLVAMHGKWYAPEVHRVPEDVFGAFAELNDERNRRLQLAERKFIDDRKQARFLYQRSWWQVGQSISVAIKAAQFVIQSVTRRKPRKEPPKGYAQIRGGKDTIAVVVYNQFLEQESRYKPFSGRAILNRAIRQHRPKFLRDVENKVRRLIRAARNQL